MTRYRAFTLLELVFTIALIGILATLSMVSSSQLISKNHKQTITDEIATAIHYAKIQALQSGAPVILSALDSSKDWSKGMKLTQFKKATHSMELLYQWQWHHPRWYLQWRGANSSEQIIISNNPIQAISNGTFVLTNGQTQECTKLVLNRLGRLGQGPTYPLLVNYSMI